jgi:DNA-binding NarL/FixJ family response regulator
VGETTIRVVLADDHPIVLQGLADLLARQQGFSIVASCRTAAEALAAVRAHDPDVLVLDVRMPDMGGLDALAELVTSPARCRVVLLTASISDADAAEAIRLGAMGLVLKESSAESLVECVRRVAAGEQWIDRATMGRAFDSMIRGESAASDLSRVLTPREIDIVRLVAEGLRNRFIAERLGITEGTVKLHLHNIYEKLHVGGRLELLVHARSSGLL